MGVGDGMNPITGIITTIVEAESLNEAQNRFDEMSNAEMEEEGTTDHESQTFEELRVSDTTQTSETCDAGYRITDWAWRPCPHCGATIDESCRGKRERPPTQTTGLYLCLSRPAPRGSGAEAKMTNHEYDYDYPQPRVEEDRKTGETEAQRAARVAAIYRRNP